MSHRLMSLVLVSATMVYVVFRVSKAGGPSVTLVLGFLLLSAYCVGFLLEKIGLPRITGYILAGLIFGPCCLKFFGTQAVTNLQFLNSLALAFIAFCAGGELKLSHIKSKIKSILYLIFGGNSVVFFGVTLFVFVFSELIPFMRGYDPALKIAISAIFGVISVARSPSSAIAVISETKAEGDFTDIVLSVTVATDVVIIILFAGVISFCEISIFKGNGLSVIFVFELFAEILVAFVLGFLLGKLLIFLIEKVKIEFPVVITIVGFLVIKFSHLIGDYMHEIHKIGLNLEPLLICMAAGFTVQNFSKHGDMFLLRMDNISYPIYIAFFAITGASIDLELLKTGWFLGLLIFIIRSIMIYIGSFFSGKTAGDEPRIYKYSWLGFITQAGVSLGLLTEVVRRFPDIGTPIQTILIATITVNQIVGPIAFKYALQLVGETNFKESKRGR